MARGQNRWLLNSEAAILDRLFPDGSFGLGTREKRLRGFATWNKAQSLQSLFNRLVLQGQCDGAIDAINNRLGHAFGGSHSW